MLALVLIAAIAAAPGLVAGGNLDEAIELYQSARYAEALQMLDALRSADGESPAPPGARESIAQYRALCLLAMNRDAEAEKAIQELVVAQPSYRPRADELPPRLVTLVERIREQQLPVIIRSEYRQGKASFDRKAYPEAEQHFRKVMELVEGDGATDSLRESMGDVTDLASGFLDIIAKSAPAAAPAPIPEISAAPGPAVNAPPLAFRVFGPSDANVRPPVAISQEVPRWTVGNGGFSRSPAANGTLEVVVDATGKVESARLLHPVHPTYDPRLLAAARRWRYSPATRDGVAVKYRKTIEIKVVDSEVARLP